MLGGLGCLTKRNFRNKPFSGHTLYLVLYKVQEYAIPAPEI